MQGLRQEEEGTDRHNPGETDGTYLELQRGGHLKGTQLHLGQRPVGFTEGNRAAAKLKVDLEGVEPRVLEGRAC